MLPAAKKEVGYLFLKLDGTAKHTFYFIIPVRSNLLKLIIALIRDNRPYEWNKDNVQALEVLEHQYQEKKARKKSYRLAS